MRHIHRSIGLATAGMLFVSIPFQALGATGPGAGEAVPRYDAETLTRLQDDIIEYDEIQNLVHEYNPTISDAWKTYEATKEDYERLITEMESQYPTIKDTADGYITAGKLMNNKEMIAAGTGLDKSYRSTLQSMRDTVNKWETNKQATSVLLKYERQMTAGAQSAMIGYDSIRKNIPTLETMVRLYERKCELAKRQVQLGVGTQADELSAQQELLSAQSQYASLMAQEDSTRRTLCLLLGWGAEDTPEIRSIPDFDMGRLEKMNLEQDTVKAIGNNYTLIEQRNSALGNTNDQMENRRRKIDEGDQKLTIEMQRLYQDVMDKKASYEAAIVGYQAALKSKEAADNQFSLGLLSEVQYIGTEISYYQKKSAMESANLTLLQAMETYDWAVMGFATVE